MSEQLCLQWSDFKENINSAFGRLREDQEFVDVTLVCEDGQHLKAHKVILAASSPFFEEILRKNKHPHPLIYFKGFQSKVLLSILDFLYFGEANVYQEELDSFLAIAEEIKLKGLTGQTSNNDVLGEQKKSNTNADLSEPATDTKREESIAETTTRRPKDITSNSTAFNKNSSLAVAIPNQYGTFLQELDEKVKSMMEKGHKMIPNGKQANGTPKQKLSVICKVCGKEGVHSLIRTRIEATHLNDISVPCDRCEKTFSSRNSWYDHKRKYH